jgi:hypothetical protein
MAAETNEDNAAARAAASGPDHLPQHGLIASFAVIALGAMLASAGIAQLFVTRGDVVSPDAFAFLAIGSIAVAASVLRALKQLRAMPPADCDCDRYGRHMIGLTFLLLVIGLSNAVGTSVLALQGGLGFSASVLIDASDPEQLKKATEELSKAQESLKQITRASALSERKKLRAEQLVQSACAAGRAESDAKPCDDAKARLTELEAQWENDDFARLDIKERVEGATKACQDKRAECKRALFFLLSLSTMMSLFGASFYVVNSVRSKRPPPPPGAASGMWGRSSFAPDRPSWARSSEPASATSRAPTNAARAASDGTTASPIASPPEPQRGEPFDVHAFWSGAFFRVGEAVLFTFAFFWLIWTSGPRTSVVWLPVLGLFVGMFVKSGEAVIFRLGMRVLYAVEALLPAAAPAPREEAPSGSGTTPSGSAEPGLDKLAGGRA